MYNAATLLLLGLAAEAPKPVLSLEGHTVEVSTVALSHDGKLLASASNREIKVWDAATGKERFSLPSGGGHVYGLAWSPDGKRLVVGVAQRARVIDAAGKDERTLVGDNQYLFRMAFSPDGKRLAAAAGQSGNKPGVVHVWDPAGGKKLLTLAGHGEAVLHVAYSPDGRWLASASGGTTGTTAGEVRLWDAGGELVRTLKGHAANVYAAAFSPDGRRLVSAGGPRTTGKGELRLWEMVSGGEMLRAEGEFSTVHAAAFSPDGRRLATAGADGTLRFWDVLSGQELLKVAAHTRAAYTAVWSPDGKRVVSAGVDKVIKVWDATSLPAPAAPKALEAAEVEARWADLAGVDAGRAARAAWSLAGSPGRAVPYLRRHLRPVPGLGAAERDRLPRLLADLDDRRFTVREKASVELTRLGEAALPLLKQALAAPRSPEVRRRLQELVDGLSQMSPSPERLRALRAVEVLERADTADARELLRELAGGLAGSPLTVEAAAALARLPR